MKLRRSVPVVLLGCLWVGMSSLGTPSVEGASVSQKRLLRFHNEERSKRNRQPLRFRASLNRAASAYARLMARQPGGQYLNHTGPDGSTFDQRILAAGGTNFTTMGENIAYGQRTEAEVTKAWMLSPGHKRNILNRRYRFVGFGKAGKAPHWVTNFGG